MNCCTHLFTYLRILFDALREDLEGGITSQRVSVAILLQKGPQCLPCSERGDFEQGVVGAIRSTYNASNSLKSVLVNFPASGVSLKGYASEVQ